MANTITSNVTITFDGLLCLDLDRERRFCKIDVHTKAKDHILKLTVKDHNGITKIKKLLSQEALIGIKNIHLFVAMENGAPLPESVSDSGSFDKILDLASEHFYGIKYPVKKEENFYGCSIWLQNGKIGAGQVDKCFRVAKIDEKDKFFESLKYDWECKQEWEGFKRGVQSTDPEKMKEHPSTFARDVIAEITLEPGQSLKMRNMGTLDDILEGKVVSGSNYDIKIEYADAFFPAGLFDCPGFAHHSEALDLPKNKPIYGIFRPAKFKDEAGTQFNTITEPALCECCRNDGTTSSNLLETFQKLPEAAVQPEALLAKSANKMKK